MRTIIIPFLSLVFLLPSANAQATIIHVPADSSCIQCAINGAVDGDTVLVARGHYYERINFLGKAILVTSNFSFDNDTATIDSTIIDADTLVLGMSDTGSVVVFVSDEDSTSVIKGFTIQNGIGTIHQGSYRCGGGIYCSYSLPTISSNAISSNLAYGGGGIACYYSSPLITNNTITSNPAEYGGGILCWSSSSPAITNNTIMSNSGEFGGGIECLASSPAITNNTITGNSAMWGGGILCESSSSPAITNNTITSNSAGLGGGIHCHGTSPTITNNTITSNSADRGGGIGCDYYSSPPITNNIISNNLDGEGIACGYGSYPTIRYNDLWNNADGNFFGCPAGVGDTAWGTNFNDAPCDSFYNIISAPLFADTITFKLLCNSPCIDAGDPTAYVPVDSGGCRIDMGTQEYFYILGDATSDSIINIADIVFVINHVYIDGPSTCPYHAADANCDGLADTEDVICLIKYLFLGGSLPCGF